MICSLSVTKHITWHTTDIRYWSSRGVGWERGAHDEDGSAGVEGHKRVGGEEEVEEAGRLRQLRQVVRKPGDVPGQAEEGLHPRGLDVRMQRAIHLRQNGQQQPQQLQHRVQAWPAQRSHITCQESVGTLILFWLCFIGRCKFLASISLWPIMGGQDQ